MALEVGTRVRSKLDRSLFGHVTKVAPGQPECLVAWDEHKNASLEWYGDLEVIESADDGPGPRGKERSWKP